MNSSNSTIAEIKDRLNIADVLSSYIQLKKAGTNFKANCPFHSEKSASFMVSSSKQIWHCFGCGEGGDIFSFVMKYENLDFSEALKLLAERAGVELPKYNKSSAKEDQYKDKLFQINDLAAKFYNKILLETPVAESARGYLKNRGLKAETVKEWQIGFAPQGYHYLEEFLLKRGFTKQELIDAGVSSKSERGEIYDRFFNRITFPIKNYTGNTVGFTARLLDDSKKAAKYINSPETFIYSKSKIIFGLAQAKQAIRKEDAVVVVEGNMDVIAAHQAGFKNVVGSSGTAFTFEQLQILSRLTKNLKFAFDTDQAGITATRRALDLALQLGFSVYIVRIPKMEGVKDPDDLIKKSPKLFAEAIKSAPLYLDYFFEKAFEKFDPNSVEQKKRISAELVPLLQSLSDPIELSHYTRMLAQRIGVPENTIYEYLAKSKIKITEKKAAVPAQRLVKSRDYLLEQKIIGYALFKDSLYQQIKQKVNLKDFRDPHLNQLYKEMLEYKGTGWDGLFDKLTPDMAELAKMSQFMVESEYNEMADISLFDREFADTVKEFKENSVKTAMRTVIAEMVAAEQAKDKEKLAKLNNEFLELSHILKSNQ
jgi:DNA primase